MSDKDDLFREIKTLLRVEKVNTALMAKLLESKALYKKDIEEHFLESIKVIPFPTGESVEYTFRLTRSIYDGIYNWKAGITDKKVHLPWESILPYDLIDKIASYPVNYKETVRIKDIKYKGSLFNISFIKYLEDAIVGIIQKIKGDCAGYNPEVETLDINQYMDLAEKEQVNIFLQYFNTYEVIRKQVLFNFFVNILPDSKVMKEII
jgi:uncharacterized protein YwgA